MPDPFWKVRPFEYLSEYVFGLALLIFSMATAVTRKIMRWTRDTRAEHWTVITGTVTTADVSAFHGRMSDLAVGRLGYSYNVNGDYYSGYFTRQFNDEQRAWSFVDARKNSQVLIRYKPNRPGTSVLRQLDQQQWPPEIPFDFWEWIPMQLRRGKRNWPSIQALVESVGRRRLEDTEGGGWVNELIFSYSVNNEYYSGVFRYSLSDDETIEEWTGRKVLIHYQPENPSKSIMFIDEQHQVESSQTAN